MLGEDKGAKRSPLTLPGCVSVVAITRALILPQELTSEIARTVGMGAEVGLKGQLGTCAGSCTFEKAETRGGGLEAPTSEGRQDHDSHVAGRPASLQETHTVGSWVQPTATPSLLLPLLKKANQVLNLPSELPGKKPARDRRQVECSHSFIHLFN